MKTEEELSLSEEELERVAGGAGGSAMTEGTAGAYGGPGTRTATGAIVDEHSMGVAIPMSWPDYRSYLGRSVFITYGGTTVLATINDVGSLNGRSLDLQPGVFRAFGFASCVEWGIRPVSYRIL